MRKDDIAKLAPASFVLVGRRHRTMYLARLVDPTPRMRPGVGGSWTVSVELVDKLAYAYSLSAQRPELWTGDGVICHPGGRMGRPNMEWAAKVQDWIEAVPGALLVDTRQVFPADNDGRMPEQKRDGMQAQHDLDYPRGRERAANRAAAVALVREGLNIGDTMVEDQHSINVMTTDVRQLGVLLYRLAGAKVQLIIKLNDDGTIKREGVEQ